LNVLIIFVVKVSLLLHNS